MTVMYTTSPQPLNNTPSYIMLLHIIVKIKNTIAKIKNKWTQEIEYRKKLKKIKDDDPFIYK